MSEIDIPRQESGILGVGRLGDIITITVTVTNVLDVIAAGFNRVLLERSIDSGITWAEIGTPDERPVLEPSRTTYKISDRFGNGGYRYRSRFLNTRLPVSDTSRCSGPSTYVLGSGIATAQVISIADLKERYLFGLRLSDDFGREWPDAAYTHYIYAAVRYVERQLDIPIIPQTFVDDLDFHATDWQQYLYVQLDNYPLISVTQLVLQYPSGQTVVVLPQEWLRINKESGVIQSVPTAGTLSQIFMGQGGEFIPRLFGGGYIPHLMRCEYVAGFAEGQIPADIVDIIGKVASLGAFNIFGDLIAGAGIATVSLSLDGLSQSIGTTSSATNAGYGSRILQYKGDVKEQLKTLRRYYNRVGGMVVA